MRFLELLYAIRKCILVFKMQISSKVLVYGIFYKKGFGVFSNAYFIQGVFTTDMNKVSAFFMEKSPFFIENFNHILFSIIQNKKDPFSPAFASEKKF